jgi:hypothetical protein
MPITVEELNKRYSQVDTNWDFNLFWGWLTKKGIPPTLIEATLKQVLIDYSNDNLPDLHHDFDNQVLGMARELKLKGDDLLTAALESALQENLKKYEADWNSLNVFQKTWEVWRGRA